MRDMVELEQKRWKKLLRICSSLENYEDDDELMLAMSELRKRRLDLKISFDEFHTVWMLLKLKKRKKMENYEIQTLREVVETNGPEVVKNFEKKFKQIRVEDKREISRKHQLTILKLLP